MIEMYLSKIVLNPLNKNVLKELSNFYEMHRTVLKAFPDGEDVKSSVLYRVEVNKKTGVPTVLIQSETEPNWNFLVSNGNRNLEPPQYKLFNPQFKKGQHIRFRLRACPSKRVLRHPDGSKAGYIKGLYEPEEQIEWLKRKGKDGGFSVHSVLTIPEGNIVGYEKKNGKKNKITIFSVVFEGILTVEDVDKFSLTLRKGIGRGKRFGFGMLSVAPLG
ncbi:MAG: type I-E CRISPR-associated protein Cas6/Cse3/CasE [Candidatus Coatesbacteria bacterium]|nr:MAG: type I-E CRISPR-associated protein Cas6/Cse3/CasE [Candidatus Coatesbacteria bacterium]